MITTGNKKSLKQVLRETVLPELEKQSVYFNTETVRAWLRQHKIECPTPTLNRYLHQFLSDRLIFAAGRGWHSCLATEFVLNREPVSSLVQQLDKTFPLLEFSCWSTGQVAGYGHLLLAKSLAFVYTDRDSIESVVEALRNSGWTAYLHPTRIEAAKSFRQVDKTVVVRPAVSRSPADGHFATIDKILVDLCVEADALRLMDAGEYQRLVANLAGRERIPVGSLLQYAARRGVKPQAVLPGLIH